MKRYILLFMFLPLFSMATFGQYQLNENCKKGWMLLMDLKIDEAKRLLSKELSINPENYYALYLDQTCDAYTLFINSDEAAYEAFLENYDKRREIMDGKFINSPYYLMCKSEMDLQTGIFKIMHGSLFGGINKSFSGYKEVYKNIDKSPDFKPSLMLDGFFNIAMSNLPPFVKSAASLLGISSDFNYGIKTLNDVYQSQKNIQGMNAESALFVIFAAKINKTPEMIYDFTHSYGENLQDLFLLKYFTANVEYRTGKNEQSLATLSALQYENSPYARLLYDYMMGKSLLRKLDDEAGQYIRRFLNHLQRKEYVKEMTYNMALFYLINGNRDKYHELCGIVKEKGSDINERDREALYDASLDYEPDINLVKARLLIDGGYSDRFKKMIRAFEINPGKGLPYQLEYNFLIGRYAIAMNNWPKAISHFKWVIENGRDEDYSFASEAALNLGEIYEKEGRYGSAKKYYKISQDLYKNRYYEYIGNKADKGLARIKILAKE